MKRINLISSTLLIISTVCFLMTIASCSSNDVKSETDRVKGILTASTWKMQTVVVDAVDQSTVYKGLTLNFTDSGFTSTNGGVVWPTSGTWKFTDDSAKTITRNDTLVITITEVTDTKLVLTLTWATTTLGSGRVESVKGSNVFTFGK